MLKIPFAKNLPGKQKKSGAKQKYSDCRNGFACSPYRTGNFVRLYLEVPCQAEYLAASYVV